MEKVNPRLQPWDLPRTIVHAITPGIQLLSHRAADKRVYDASTQFSSGKPLCTAESAVHWLKVRVAMKLNRNDGEVGPTPESADRRQFLRNAMKIGGAAALLLTSASRAVLARSLSLNERDLDAARRAQQAKGAPADPSRNPEQLASMSSGGFEDCPCTSCTGACTGQCTSCTGCSGCTASCSNGCDSNCGGGCEGSCKGLCSGCSGVNL
jgi:hypothetical protein